MKKHLFSFLVGMAYVLHSSAQITITQADLPVIGQTWSIYNDSLPVTSQIIDGPGGNKVWNYSTGWGINSIVTRTHVAPATLPEVSLFPGANVGIIETGNGTTGHIFTKNLPTAWVILGGNISAGTANFFFNYMPGISYVKLPLSYGQDYIDTNRYQVTLSYAVPGYPINRTSTYRIIHITCDAWGTLTTPLETAQALRVKTQILSRIDSSFVDSTGTGNNFTFTQRTLPVSSTTTYDYYRNGPTFAFLSLDANNATGAINFKNYVHSGITGTEAFEETTRANVYPNPAADYFSIQSNGTEAGFVILRDMEGRTINRWSMKGTNLLQVFTGDLSNGVYVLEQVDEAGNRTGMKKLMIQK